ncbi:hypothetical protein BP5796_03824 [Coleophoma crateriformis]|uniref:C3H1-type domain-containing protein n=1 Tax=Coleophoma crateriformis TaxID=565419 RepID=A0A3D8SGL7_9HELO|nr:hypothetical protein BP5796_03824 [Coleophoma crateriformis]
MPCCMDFMARGRCRILDKGGVCELNHDLDLYNEARKIGRESIQLCADYIRHGQCRFGARCRHIHSNELRQAKVARDIVKGEEREVTRKAQAFARGQEAIAKSITKPLPQIMIRVAATAKMDGDHGNPPSYPPLASVAIRGGSVTYSSSTDSPSISKATKSIILPKYQPDISFETFFQGSFKPRITPKAKQSQPAMTEITESIRSVEKPEPEIQRPPSTATSNLLALKQQNSMATLDQHTSANSSVPSVAEQNMLPRPTARQTANVPVSNEICWYFINKRCKYGRGCPRYHDAVLRSEKRNELEEKQRSKHGNSNTKLGMRVAVDAAVEPIQQPPSAHFTPVQEQKCVKPAANIQTRNKALPKNYRPENQRKVAASAGHCTQIDMEPANKNINRSLQYKRTYYTADTQTNGSPHSLKTTNKKVAYSRTPSAKDSAMHSSNNGNMKSMKDCRGRGRGRAKHTRTRRESFSIWNVGENPRVLDSADLTAFPTLENAALMSKNSTPTQENPWSAPTAESKTAMHKKSRSTNTKMPKSLGMIKPNAIPASSAWSRPISIPERHKPKPPVESPKTSFPWNPDDDIRWATENLDPKRRAIFFKTPEKLQPMIDRGPLFEFHKFGLFPAEIRLQIWELCAKNAGPRTVRLEYHEDCIEEDTYEVINTYFSSESSLPAMFHVNREARAVALPYYEQAFSTVHHLGSIPFNFSKDELFLRCPGAGFLSTTIGMIPERDCMRIKKVYIALKDWVFCEGEHTFTMNIAKFRACRRLLLVAGDGLTERKWTQNQEKAIEKLQKVLLPRWNKLNHTPPPTIRFWIIPALKARELRIDSFYW